MLLSQDFIKPIQEFQKVIEKKSKFKNKENRKYQIRHPVKNIEQYKLIKLLFFAMRTILHYQEVYSLEGGELDTSIDK